MNIKNKTTAFTILYGIGFCKLHEYIYKLPSPDFHSHDFTSNFGRFFPDEYDQMLELYENRCKTKNPNMAIAASIGRFLLKESDSLKIKKETTCRSTNMNGNMSEAHTWHKTAQS